MNNITLICDDAANHSFAADMIFTDPPFDMSGKELHNIISKYTANHLVLICTMKQLLEFNKDTHYNFSFDFVVDNVSPKKSKSINQPNYTHATGVYMTKKGIKSAFNRKLRQRSDMFKLNGYWPTIFYAPKERRDQHSLAKNETTITDILGSFEVDSVIDMFAGSGTTGFAAFELNKKCILIEKEREYCEKIEKKLKFYGVSIGVSINGE